jgi:hypothetical protein
VAKLALPPEALSLFRGLLETYDRIKANAGAPNRPGTNAEVEILRNRLDDPSALWWTDLEQAEICVIDVTEEADLRARLAGWQRRFQEVLGDARQDSDAGFDAKTSPIETVRAKLEECVHSVYYFYGAYGVAARSRSDVTKQTLGVSAVIIALEIIVAILVAVFGPNFVQLYKLQAYTITGIEFFIAASAMAVVGSAVSVQARLQDPSVQVDPFYRYIQTRADRLSIAVVSPLFAAIFGGVIFGLMASGLTGGNAFPHVSALMSDKPPIGDVALLLIYGFIAGFAERLVPDALTRIASTTIASITGGTSGQNIPGASPSAPSIKLSIPSIAIATGQQATFTATVIGAKDDVAAQSSNAAVATVDPGTQKGPGPVTFTVRGLTAGVATISLKSGTSTATLSVTVT